MVPLLLSLAVEAPVSVEVTVCEQCTQFEDRLGTVEAPACTSDAHAVLDDVAAGPLDGAGRDRPA
jgi:hypothetical protein